MKLKNLEKNYGSNFKNDGTVCKKKKHGFGLFLQSQYYYDEINNKTNLSPKFYPGTTLYSKVEHKIRTYLQQQN